MISIADWAQLKNELMNWKTVLEIPALYNTTELQWDFKKLKWQEAILY